MSLLPSSNGTALIEVLELNFKKIYRPGMNRAKFSLRSTILKEGKRQEITMVALLIL